MHGYTSKGNNSDQRVVIFFPARGATLNDFTAWRKQFSLKVNGDTFRGNNSSYFIFSSLLCKCQGLRVRIFFLDENQCKGSSHFQGTKNGSVPL